MVLFRTRWPLSTNSPLRFQAEVLLNLCQSCCIIEKVKEWILCPGLHNRLLSPVTLSCKKWSDSFWPTTKKTKRKRKKMHIYKHPEAGKHIYMQIHTKTCITPLLGLSVLSGCRHQAGWCTHRGKCVFTCRCPWWQLLFRAAFHLWQAHQRPD